MSKASILKGKYKTLFRYVLNKTKYRQRRRILAGWWIYQEWLYISWRTDSLQIIGHTRSAYIISLRDGSYTYRLFSDCHGECGTFSAPAIDARDTATAAGMFRVRHDGRKCSFSLDLTSSEVTSNHRRLAFPQRQKIFFFGGVVFGGKGVCCLNYLLFIMTVFLVLFNRNAKLFCRFS